MIDQKQNKVKLSAIPGLAVIGCLVTGIAGLIIAFCGGGGLCIIGSALAFGIVLYCCVAK